MHCLFNEWPCHVLNNLFRFQHSTRFRPLLLGEVSHRALKGLGDNIIPTTHQNDVTLAARTMSQTHHTATLLVGQTPHPGRWPQGIVSLQGARSLAARQGAQEHLPAEQRMRLACMHCRVFPESIARARLDVPDLQVGHRAPGVWGASSSPLNVTNTPHGKHTHTHIESGLLLLLPTHFDMSKQQQQQWIRTF